MAKLLKERARKPLMDSANPIASTTWEGGQIGFRLDLYAGAQQHGHFLIMTRDEMLRTVATWLTAEARMASESLKKSEPRP